MAQTRARTLTYGVAAAAMATMVAACGGGSSGGGNQSVGPPAAGGGGSALSTHTTSIGKVLADSSGKTIYELVGNPASNAKCNSSCEGIWPPVMSGGSVKVLDGHPLFTFTGDSSAGQVNGEGTKDNWGVWLAVNPSGAPIAASGGGAATPTATPTKSSSGGGGGGYGY